MRTYQDGTAIGGIVCRDFWGVFGGVGVVLDLSIGYLPRKVCAPTCMGSGRGTCRGCLGGWGGEAGRLEGLHCSIGDACSRWSHMCGSWYFPRSLLRVGYWMHMNMASLMVLEWLVTSLCTMLNCSGSTGCPVVVLCKWMGEGALNWFLTLSPKDLSDSPMYALGQFIWGHL